MDHVGQLARELFTAQADHHEVQDRVEGLITSLFPGWRGRLPRHLGWTAAPPNRIEIYEVYRSPAALHALGLAGFHHVVLHEHQWTGSTKDCACEVDVVDPPAPSRPEK